MSIEKQVAEICLEYPGDILEPARPQIDVLQERVALYPKARCLLCTNFEIKHRAYCKIAKTMPGCGRNFNPRQGGMGSLVLV